MLELVNKDDISGVYSTGITHPKIMTHSGVTESPHDTLNYKVSHAHVGIHGQVVCSLCNQKVPTPFHRFSGLLSESLLMHEYTHNNSMHSIKVPLINICTTQQNRLLFTSTSKKTSLHTNTYLKQTHTSSSSKLRRLYYPERIVKLSLNLTA